jgi:hemoglobin
MHAYMRWAVDDVLTVSPVGTVVPAGVPMPHWDWDGLRP